jgi:hypothetical protein
MKNIRYLPERFDVVPLLRELASHPEVWNVHRWRTEHPRSPHHEVSDIWVRYNAVENIGPQFNDPHIAVWYPVCAVLPSAKLLALDVANRNQASSLGGVLITKIPGGNKVHPHVDGGWHALHYEKIAVQLAGNEKQAFCFEGESLSALPGESYWFHNQSPHWVDSLMPWGIAVAAGIGAVGSIAAGGEAESGEEQAANTQAGMFNTIQGNEQPFIKGGQTALNSLLQGEGLQPGSSGGIANGYLNQQFNPTQSQLESYPGYQFELNQGEQAVQNSAAATTGAASGPAMKSLASFAQGLASSDYSNYFNQFQTQQNNIFNRLSSIAGLGQNAAGNLGNNGAQLGTGIAQAQASAAGSIANSISGATGNIGQSIALNSLLSNGGGLTSNSQANQDVYNGYQNANPGVITGQGS